MPFFTAHLDNTIRWESQEGPLCIEAIGDKSGAAVGVNQCNGGPAQLWNFVPLGRGEGNHIRLKDTTFCVDVNMYASQKGGLDGAPIELRECGDKATEFWKFEAPSTKTSAQDLFLRNVMYLISIAALGALSLGAWIWRRQPKVRTVTTVPGGMFVDVEGRDAGLAMTAPVAVTPSSRTGDMKMSVAGDQQDFGTVFDQTPRRTFITHVAAGLTATLVPQQQSALAAYVPHKEEVPELSKLGYDVSPLSWREIDQEAAEANLTGLQRAVAFQRATEKAFTGKTTNGYSHDNKKPGYYVGAISGLPLFSSNQKYDSGTGWPSFWAPVDEEHIATELDPEDQRFAVSTKIGSEIRTVRTEVLDPVSGAHLGHVFDDGPQPTGKRYCINAAALTFVPSEKGIVPIETKFLAMAGAKGSGK
jgi:methionine-R-sulfoxide reductase